MTGQAMVDGEWSTSEGNPPGSAGGGMPAPDDTHVTHRERELAAIIDAYNEVTERLKSSHERLIREVARLRQELERKNRQLRRRERLAALGELAAGVAHEIRNPLGGIRMFASLLRQDLTGRPDALRLVEKISSGVTRLERIVTDILEFGRPAEPNPEPANLENLFKEVSELAVAKRPGARVCVTPAAGEGPLELVTDGPLLHRALLNLVLNGIEAAQAAGGPPPCVELRACRPDRGQVLIEVLDNGPGIAAELLDTVFNPFFTTKATGTGLGLAIVHQTIETLGGSIQAGNRPEGGAVFRIQLPLVQEGAGDGTHRARRFRRSSREAPAASNAAASQGSGEVGAAA